MTESVPINTPLADLDMDADTAHYVGVLEGTIATQVIQINKFRALLELLTGDPWEDVKLDPNGEKLKEISISALVKQTGISLAQAKVLVEKRWNERNQSEDNSSLENDSAPTPTVTESVNMSQRFRDWRAKQVQVAQDATEETSRDDSGMVPVTAANPVVPLNISVDAKTE